MARDLTTAFKNAGRAVVARPAIFVEIDTQSASKRRPVSTGSTPGWGVATNLFNMIDGNTDTYAQLSRRHFGLSDSGTMLAFDFPGIPFTLDDGAITVTVTLETLSEVILQRRIVVFCEHSDGSGVSATPDGYNTDVDTPKTTFSHTFAAGTCPATLYLFCEIVSLALGEDTNVIRIYNVTIQKEKGDVFVWNGVGTKSWNGHDWQGLGKFGNISPISESMDMTVSGVKLILSGIPSDMVSLALDELTQFLPATVWFGYLEDDDSVVADPFVAFKGKCDTVEMEDSGETSTLTISVESNAIVHRKPQGLRYTDADQQIIHPGDRGFEFVDKFQETNIPLGAAGRLPITTPTYPD